MKKPYLVTEKNSEIKTTPRFWSVKYLYFASFVLAFFLLALLSACHPDTFSESGLLTAEETKARLEKKLNTASDIRDNIRNSYARLAAKRSDICPKLIQEEVDNPVVRRTKEVMTNNYCDYFLYPREGQRISVTINDSQIEALLVVPALHNFANGDYRVASYDKHIIRLTYNGATYKPESLVYDVAVTVFD